MAQQPHRQDEHRQDEHRHEPHRCLIVPPYLLEAVARAEAGRFAGAARAARASLEHDQPLRAARAQATPRRSLAAPGSAAPGAVPRGTLDALGPPTPGAPRRLIADAQGLEALPGRAVRREGDPPSGEQSTDQAYDGLGSGYALFWQAFGRDSIDDANLPLEATVHYGTAYDNAFWNGSRMVFGDGDGEVFRGFTGSLSVIGHELAHGVTESTAGLAYQGQSGALNEHISDVFGALTEQHSRDQGASQASWLIGSEIFTPAVQGRALRDMRNPGTAYDDDVLGSDPQPAHMRGYVTTLEDNGGVHLNSGIPNRAFALAALALGGAAWNGAGLIWYRALTAGGLEADAGFERFARATLDAAAGLFGPGSAERRAVQEGWTEVGVPAAPDGAAR